MYRTLPLLVVLGVQAALSARLVDDNTAFVDEADYLWAGKQIWDHGLAPLGFQEYFSGSPKVYPLLASVIDGIGGLVAARLLSLLFMLGVTIFIYKSANRLFGQYIAFFSAAIFAVVTPTQFLGAFATFDAMALFFLASSLWCVVRSAGATPNEKYFLLAASLLLLANITKYVTLVFDPIVVLTAVVLYWDHGRKLALRRGVMLGGLVGGVGLMLVVGAGPSYWRGMVYTTLLHNAGNVTAAEMLGSVWQWIGLVIALAATGLIVFGAWLWRRDKRTTLLLLLYSAALLLVPLGQLRIHTLDSLHKHVGFGVVFGAIAGGFFLAMLAGKGLKNVYRLLPGLALVALIGYQSFADSTKLYSAWSNTTELVSVMRPLVEPGSEKYLVEDTDLVAYYTDPDIDIEQWRNMITFSYDDPETNKTLKNLAGWKEAIHDRYFSVVEISFSSNPHADRIVAALLEESPDYELVAKIANYGSWGKGYYQVWTLTGNK